MAKGDGLRAKCPYFRARVDWNGSFIQCETQDTSNVLMNPAIINHYRVCEIKGLILFSRKDARDAYYAGTCCPAADCLHRERYEKELVL